jgi:tripartite-type tricarboxylate transporter receptor subunit TctC
LLVDDFFVGQWLSERLGQQFIVDNRPGAGGNIGTETVVRAPADGYTLLLVCASSAINATLFDKLNYDFIRDITPKLATSRRKRPILWKAVMARHQTPGPIGTVSETASEKRSRRWHLPFS